MGPNGVSHTLVDSHAGAVSSALRWLSYVPSSRGSYLPVVSGRVLMSLCDMVVLMLSVSLLLVLSP